MKIFWRSMASGLWLLRDEHGNVYGSAYPYLGAYKWHCRGSDWSQSEASLKDAMSALEAAVKAK